MILRLLIGAIVIYLMLRFVRKNFPQMRGKTGPAEIKTAVAGEELVEDPICHTYIPIGNACKMQIDGKTIYFCSVKCLEQYKTK
jgi:YHS domain-containing protein